MLIYNLLQMEYGPQRTDAYTTLQATVIVQKAINQAGLDGNMYKLGVSLAEAILLCEYAISAGLGLKRPVDFLPECAKAIREKGAPAEQYLADILECK